MPHKSKIDRALWQKNYRATRKLSGNPLPRGSNSRQSDKHGYDKIREVIAWDGEGINDESYADSEGRIITPHRYTLFAASTGHTISSYQLGTREILRLFLQVEKEHPNAWHVMFAGNYDFTHILRDIPRELLQDISKQNDKMRGILWNGYQIFCIPRKELWIKRGDISLTVWDTFGFFQAKFSDVVESMLGADYPDLDFIRQGKALRDKFNETDPQFIAEYNQAELRALVKIMEIFDGSMIPLKLRPNRWDGAGAIAGAMLKKHDIKEHIESVPSMVEQAARFAYFGGRFELGMYGFLETLLHFYDINSAYPTNLVELPSLKYGKWHHDKTTVQPFGLYNVSWNLPGIKFGPFGYRFKNHVYYPSNGRNWVWGYELCAYLDWAKNADNPGTIEIHDGYWFEEFDKSLHPYDFVREYYYLRQSIINREVDLPQACAMPLKLGINSVYGKTMQAVGYDIKNDKKPPYHSIVYGGAITSATRAKLWSAAMQHPNSIIMLATDGIFSTHPLDLPISTSKELGKWEYKTGTAICSVQSGIYTARNLDGNWRIQSRGIDKQAKNDERTKSFIDSFNEQVINGWKRREKLVKFPATRLITFRQAKMEPTYPLRGYWVQSMRDVGIVPEKEFLGKRSTEDRKTTEPWHSLVFTVPNRDVDSWLTKKFHSQPYCREWDEETDAAFLEEELELWDANF